MSKSEIRVAKATEKVMEPVEFTGTIKSVRPVMVKNGNGNKELIASVDIAELPNLYNKTEAGETRKATILRTRKQLLADLSGYVDEVATMEELILSADIYATKRPVTLLVSAHEKGAKTIVTANSTYALQGGAEIGEEVEVSSAGFYVEGFLDIEYSTEMKLKRLEQMRKARATATAEEL